jgi:hypothetical protein
LRGIFSGYPFSRGQVGVVITEVTIKIPSWIERPAVFFLLLYRRARYGYRFRRIKLTLGKYAIVDPEDYYGINKHKWNAYRGYSSFYSKRKIYNRKNGTERTVYMHRLIMNAPKGLVVDHINHNGLDNRKSNLRFATRAENNRYARKTKNKFRSDYKGVYYIKKVRRWRARITFEGKTRYVGQFKDEISAGKAYDRAAKKYFGDFACLNFPE